MWFFFPCAKAEAIVTESRAYQSYRATTLWRLGRAGSPELDSRRAEPPEHLSVFFYFFPPLPHPPPSCAPPAPKPSDFQRTPRGSSGRSAPRAPQPGWLLGGGRRSFKQWSFFPLPSRRGDFSPAARAGARCEYILCLPVLPSSVAKVSWTEIGYQFVNGGEYVSMIYGPYDSNLGSRRVHKL